MRPVVAGLLAAAAIAACGRDVPEARTDDAAGAVASAGAGPEPVDACALLPQADLERILGGVPAEAEPAQPIDAGGTAMRGCAWRTLDNTAGASLQVRTGAQYRPDPAAFDRYADGFEQNMGTRPEVEQVTGLGSTALWDRTNHVLLVRSARPGHEISVQPYLSRRVPMVELDRARALAEAVLERLPH